jgi:DNA polymerase-3 subunit epsilon
MLGQKFAIVDIETTGGKPGRDKIIEIAIVIIENEQIIGRFETLLDPECAIPHNITYLTGIRQGMVDGKPKFFEIAKDIVELTKDCIFVAHNVRFDYSFIREQFKGLGFTYSRKTLCTVRLSRKAFTHLPKHSLGFLIQHFEIKVDNRHRAMADVLATWDVLKRIMVSDAFEEEMEQVISMGIKESLLPQNLSKSDIESLPEDAGVYYMHDLEGRPVYIGKSINIRSRVSSHFNKKTSKGSKLQQQVESISYQLTGSDLMASFLESLEIKRYLPSINRAQKQVNYPYHIHKYVNEAGYLCLRISKKKKTAVEENLVASFASKAGLYSKLAFQLHKHDLCSKLIGLSSEDELCFNHQIGKCGGACGGIEAPTDYNQRLEESLEHLSQELMGSFLILEKGRNAKEKGIILVINGSIKSYGFLDEDNLSYQYVDDLEQALEPIQETAELRYIIKRYLAKKGRKKIIPVLS